MSLVTRLIVGSNWCEAAATKGRQAWYRAFRVMQQPDTDALWAALRLVAPGTPLREGIDRILQANMGALIVVGDGPDVLGLCSGGFPLGVDFTPQRFSELAKMDGAIILSADTCRIS